jgi:hypothetical protein
MPAPHPGLTELAPADHPPPGYPPALPFLPNRHAYYWPNAPGGLVACYWTVEEGRSRLTAQIAEQVAALHDAFHEAVRAGDGEAAWRVSRATLSIAQRTPPELRANVAALLGAVEAAAEGAGWVVVQRTDETLPGTSRTMLTRGRDRLEVLASAVAVLPGVEAHLWRAPDA